MKFLKKLKSYFTTFVYLYVQQTPERNIWLRFVQQRQHKTTLVPLPTNERLSTS